MSFRSRLNNADKYQFYNLISADIPDEIKQIGEYHSLYKKS